MKYFVSVCFILSLFVNAKAQGVFVTNFSGTAIYGHIDVTVTSSTPEDSIDVLYTCMGLPKDYWIGLDTGSWIKYSFSHPIKSINLRTESMNSGPFSMGEYIEVEVNGIIYPLSPAEVNTYTTCGCAICGPTYLFDGKLFGPTNITDTQYNGGDITINHCSGINTLKVRNGHNNGGSCYHLKIDTTIYSTLPGSILGPDTICAGSTAFYNDSSAGGVWSTSNVSVATISSGTVTAISPGTAIISYTLSGCSVAKLVRVINLPASGFITLSAANSFCIGETRQLMDSNPGGVWSHANGHTIITGDSIKAISFGWDTVYYTTTNVCGTNVDELSVPVFYTPQVSGKLTVCVGDTVYLSDSLIGGMWNTAQWSTIGIYSTITSSGIVVGLAPGTAIITYQIDLGCASYTPFTVYALPPIQNIVGPDALCKGATFTFHDAAPNGYWETDKSSIAPIDSPSGNGTALSAGVATITYKIVSNADGCTNMATHQLTIYDAPPFNDSASITPLTCHGYMDAGINLTMQGVGSFTFLWNNGNTSNHVNNLGSGKYTVSITDHNMKCTLYDTISVSQPDSIIINLAGTNDVCNRGVGQISVSVSGGNGGYQYQWSDNDTHSNRDALLPGVYHLLVSDKLNCKDSSVITIGEDICPEIMVHDVITPNGDGINDTWIIEGIGNYPANCITIFDKWGDKVYEQSGYKNDWQGKGRGSELLPDGTYFYIVQLNEANHAGGENIFKGSLLIKR